MFPVGTQYHRPPTPKAEKWEDDFALMKRCGFNIARGWAMWSWLNPGAGRYDFSELDRLCDLGEKNDIQIILLVNIESCPAWVHRKHPQSVYVSRTGRPVVPHTVHNTCVGGFPGLCLDHDGPKAAAGEFIERLVSHFAGHPALHGWEPHNEPLIEPARYNHEVFCYCPKTAEKFVAWLREKYGRIEAVNDAWQRRFGEFDEILPPTELGSFGDWTDWRLFAIESLVAQDAWRIELIRRNDPDRPVLMHSRGGGDRRDIVCDGTDDWRLAALADKFGYANFPQGKTVFEHALSGDLCRSAAQGKEFWMHELQSGPFGIGLQRNNPFFVILGKGGGADVDVAARPDEVGSVTGDRLALWSWLPIAQGAKGLLYWQFRTEQFGAEYGFNLVNLDGTATERLDAAARIASCIRDNEQMLQEMRPPASQAAIGFSPMNAMLTYFADGNLNAYLASFLGANRLLAHCGHPLDVVRTDSHAVDDDFSKYQAMVLPLPLWVDEPTAAKLARFVEGGGLLISEPSLGQTDTDFFSADVVPGMGLDKVFGCRREIVSTRQSVPVTVNGQAVPSRFFEEILIPSGAEVIGTYASGAPAVTMNRFGAGAAVYLGTNLFMEYIFSEDPAARRVFADLAADLRPWATSSSIDTVVRWLEAPEGGRKLVFLFNGFNRPAETTLTLAAPVEQATDIWNGGSVSFRASGGAAKAEFSLKPYDTRILLIEGA